MNSNTWRRGFWGVWLTQFQESFADNAYRFLVLAFVADMAIGEDTRGHLTLLAGLLFAAPFVLFSPMGGFLADRHSKRSVILGTKLVEIPIMIIALLGLMLHSLPVLLAALFLRGIQSSCYSPSKLGMLPEILPLHRLSWGNGLIEVGSFAAIICGTIAGSSMYIAFGNQLSVAGIILLATAFLGLAVATALPRVHAAGLPSPLRFNPFSELAAQWRTARKDRTLFLALLGSSYFFLLAALLQITVVYYGKDILRISEDQTGYLQAAIAIGIGLGSVAAGYLSAGKIEYGLIPLGSAGLTVFALLLSQDGLTFLQVAWLLGLLGFAGGFFIVPIMAIIQHRPAAENKGRMIAASNQLAFIGIGLASVLFWLLTTVFPLSIPAVFAYGGLMTLGATAYATRLMPDSLLRLVMWAVAHSIYRIRVVGSENIPVRGGALLVSNHLSLVDALMIAGSTERHVRFLMFKDIYDRPGIHFFAKALRTIPISAEQSPKEMIRSLRAASAAVAGGEVVCIFAEGSMTRIGHLLPFRRGFERIMKGVDAPIIPVHLDGLWGSIFSFERGRYLWKLPKRLWLPITVSYGSPMPPTSTTIEVREAVQSLQTDAFNERAQRLSPLPYAFIKTARRHPLRLAVADANKSIRFGAALSRSLYLAKRLRPTWKGQNMVGILLPPSPAAALVNFAALLEGTIPVNLNYTLSADGIASCMRQCNIDTVITSRAFLERMPIHLPGRVVLLEDAAAAPRLWERIAALAKALLLPASMLVRRKIRSGDLATVIFSSGSTGEPKGVMLTHANIASNVAQLEQCFALEPNDRLLGILPLFHSFGFTGTLALPLTLGQGVAYHPNPFDAKSIGALVSRYKVSFLLATPTFLQGYIRRCDAGQFGSLKLVLVGAEKLREPIAQAFEDKFGIRPLEAYGCTECAPAVTANTRDFRTAGLRQVGARRGKIGHALPGISIRIVDPETFEPLPAGRAGLMLVRGPNVMQGYLGRPEATARVMRDGWYVTGDIATMDEDGFVEITDRLSRFSKIGGEMVPHVKVEEKLHELAGASEQIFAVTGVPDDRKGERLVVLHTLEDERLAECIARLGQSGLPNLWLPRPQAFVKVEALPYLGTGKLDLRKIKDIAGSIV